MNGSNFISRCYGTEPHGKYVLLAETETIRRLIVCSRIHDIHNIHYIRHILGSQQNGLDGWVYRTQEEDNKNFPNFSLKSKKEALQRKSLHILRVDR
jgi:hypothetical protein